MERFDKSYEADMPDGAEGQKNIEMMATGIDGGEMLLGADGPTLMAQHLLIEKSDAKAFFKDGLILSRMWIDGSFCKMIPLNKETGNPIRETNWPYTKDGFEDCLHAHGSQNSPEENGRRMSVYRAYNKYSVTVIRLVEAAGISKAFLAIKHITDETVAEMLQFCIDTPYHRLKDKEGLRIHFPRPDGWGRIRSRKSEEQRRKDDETRAVKTLERSKDGVIGSPAICVIRQFRQDWSDEMRLDLTLKYCMSRSGFNGGRDAFLMQRVVPLISEKWLTDADRNAIEQAIDAARAGRSFGQAAE